MRRLLLLLCLFGPLGLPGKAGAIDLEATAQRFEHPERYRLLFSRLIDRGVPVARVQAAFSSEKALQRDRRAVELRTDISRIPEHQADEREANDRYLAEASTLAEHLRKHSELYRRMESEFQIRREVIGAILLKESALGEYDGFDHDAFVVFNSLHDGLEVTEDLKPRLRRRIPRLIQMAREQLIALVIHAYRNDLALEETPFPASYAGAIGIPQWLPVHLDYTVSVDDSAPDLSKLPDAVPSTANLIRNNFDWPDRMLDFERLTNMADIVAAWRRFDDGKAGFATGKTADGQTVRRFDRAHADMPNVTYLATFVRALMRYNYSSEYALGVLRIANRAYRLRTDSD